MESPHQITTESTLALEGLAEIDIFCQIVQHIQDATRQKSLLSIALTCKTLSEHALDFLWRDLASLIPVLRLIPSLTVMNGSYTLLGPVNAEDFIRFDFHAHRVRSIQLTELDNTPIDSSVFLRIAQIHREPILPLLQRIHITSTAELGPSPVLLIAPTLRSIHFDSDMGIRQSIVFATMLSNSADSVLDELILEGIFPARIFGLIPQFRNLQKLEMSGISESIRLDPFLKALVAISRAAQLRSLILRGVPEVEHGNRFPREILPPDVFPILTEMAISAAFSFIEHLVSCVGNAVQKTTLIFMSGPPNPRFANHLQIARAWRSLFDLIARRWHSSLERIVIDTSHHVSAGFGDLFGGLWSVLNLREVRLFGGPIILHEEDIITLAIGCPNIETLVIDIGGSQWERSPCIGSLFHFTCHCSSLIHLEITLDIYEEMGQESGVLAAAHGLETLILRHNIRHQNLPDLTTLMVQAVAKFLDATFPKLDSVHGVDGLEAQCNTVHSWVKLLQGARANERRRINSA
ncbi:hypothetical protein C8R44DRAFT_740096 [Mycena epipterygia]|nr:hypothetical protein C8R44DRAFT_740096 [Mycena epipterygia]